MSHSTPCADEQMGALSKRKKATANANKTRCIPFWVDTFQLALLNFVVYLIFSKWQNCTTWGFWHCEATKWAGTIPPGRYEKSQMSWLLSIDLDSRDSNGIKWAIWNRRSKQADRHHRPSCGCLWNHSLRIVESWEKTAQVYYPSSHQQWQDSDSTVVTASARFEPRGCVLKKSDKIGTSTILYVFVYLDS